MIIGLTGGSGSGKGETAKLFGCRVIDCDEIYHELMATCAPMREEISNEFGTLDKKTIGSIVFNDKERLQILNAITHKYVIEEVKKRINGDCVIDAPLLFESGIDSFCDITVALIANKRIRAKRIMARDDITQEQAARRIMSQPSDDFYIKNADFILTNNSSSFAELEEEMFPKVQKLKTKFARKVAVYGGTFDPPTLGHLDVIRRAAKHYDKLYVVALINHTKKPIFSTDDRIQMLKMMTDDLVNIEVDKYSGLLVDYAYSKGAHYSVRGLRNGTDLEYERPMFEFNSQIAFDQYDGYELETSFFPTTRENFDTSSSNVRALLSGGAFKTARRYLDERIWALVERKYMKPQIDSGTIVKER